MDVAAVDYFLLNDLDPDDEVDASKHNLYLLSTLREVAINRERGGFIQNSYDEKMRFIDNISRLLDNKSTYVRRESLNLLVLVIPHLGKLLDTVMPSLFIKTLRNIGHKEKRIRYSTVQVMFLYAQNTRTLQQFLKLFIKHGIKADEMDNRRASLYAIMVSITKDIVRKDIFILIKALSLQLAEREPYLFLPTFYSLNYLHNLVGEELFNQYMDRIGIEASAVYQSVLVAQTSKQTNNQIPTDLSKSGSQELEYGVFDKNVFEKIKNDDWHIRNEGLEAILKVIQSDNLARLIPHLGSFLATIGILISDCHPIVIFTALQIYRTLLNRLRNRELLPFLRTITTLLTVNLGSEKVFREQIMSTLHQLIHQYEPMPVLKVLLEQSKNRNPKVRVEVINRVTSSLLHFPKSKFDYRLLFDKVGPALGDKVVRVRIAALECMVVAAATLGPQWKSLIGPVVHSCADTNGEEVMNIIEDRISNNKMPTCSSDGVMHYSVKWIQSPTNEVKRQAKSLHKVSTPNPTLQKHHSPRDGYGEPNAQEKGTTSGFLVRTKGSHNLEVTTAPCDRSGTRILTPCTNRREADKGVCSLKTKEGSRINPVANDNDETDPLSTNDEAQHEERDTCTIIRKRTKRKVSFKRKCCKRPGHRHERHNLIEWRSICQSKIETSRPLENPEEELDAALKYLATNDWNLKKKAMDIIITISKFHSHLLKNVMNHLILKLMDEVKSLRSLLSRPAIATLGEMARNLKRAVEPAMYPVVALLLQKSGNKVNAWMKGEIENTLIAILEEGMTPQRGAIALISGGATNGSKDVRQTTAKFLMKIVENLGAQKCLSSYGNFTAELLPAAAKFLTDNSTATRYYGRRIFAVLMKNEDFYRYLNRYLSHHTASHISKSLESIREQGPGPIPNELLQRK